MNLIRKFGYLVAIVCLVIAAGFGVYGYLYDASATVEFAISLCGAGLFFAAPKAIIPVRSQLNQQRDSLDLLGEVCASGFYAGVLIILSIMGLSYIQALFTPSGSSAEGLSVLGSVVFLGGFVFSLIAHVLSATSALILYSAAR